MTTQTEGPKFPHITVILTGKDGNAWAIMGAVRKALKNAKVSKEDIEQYSDESMAGDYDNLLIVAMNTVNVI